MLLAGLELEESFEGIKGLFRKASFWRRRSSKLSGISSPFSRLSPKRGWNFYKWTPGEKNKKNISQGQNFSCICLSPILPRGGDLLLQRCSYQVLPKSCSPGHTRLSSNLEGKGRQLVSTGKKNYLTLMAKDGEISAVSSGVQQQPAAPELGCTNWSKSKRWFLKTSPLSMGTASPS